MKNVYEHCISNCIIENKLLSWVKHIKMTAVLVSRICLHPQNLTKISFIFIYMLFFRIWQQTNINRDTCVKYQVLQWPRYRDIDHCLRRFDRSLSTQNRSNCRVGFRRVRSGQSVPAAALAINGFSSGSSIVLSTFFKFSKQPEAMAPSGLVYAKGLRIYQTCMSNTNLNGWKIQIKERNYTFLPSQVYFLALSHILSH